MHSGWDARKRNRNIGTRKRGHGQDNRLVIPRGIHDRRIFWEKLSHPVPVARTVGGWPLTFLVEPTFPGYVHACTIDDICFVLEAAPRDHRREVQLIILRQPKRKENILNPAWGRFLYYADTGKHQGTAICLEAQNPRHGSRWSKSLSPDDREELERLRDDGHIIAQDRRAIRIMRTLETIRATQLYRTLLHELGHAADWLIHCLRTDTSSAAFHARPTREKEAFAHRYARELRTSLELRGRIPLPRILNLHSLARDGLRLEWFQNPRY